MLFSIYDSSKLSNGVRGMPVAIHVCFQPHLLSRRDPMEWDPKRWKRSDLIQFLASEGLPHLPASHPARITIRASSLALSLAIVPSLVPLLTSREARKRFRLSDLLKRELGPNGFPFAIVLVLGGSAWLEWAWK